MKKLILCAAIFTSLCQHTSAQGTFVVNEYVDINKIKAAVQLHGDLWWDPTTMNASCEFPKGTNKHLQHASSIWMAGYDANSDLHLSAQTYRQTGNDYWPGPLDASDTLTMTTSANWGKVWKLNRTTIDSFLALSTHTIANTPKVILEWPAKGNPNAKGIMTALVITEDMAPFTDVNNDGNYNALDGDYPAIKGDQAIWWVFSDNGPAHDNEPAATGSSKPLKVQVNAMAYAYSRGTLIDNVVFYEYEVINKSSETYNDFRFGLWSDADLGYFGDDYVGFDSARRLGYVYNRNTVDNIYGTALPTSGVTFLEMPGDNSATTLPVGSFMFYENLNVGYGNPAVDTEYNHYLRARFRDGAHLKNDFIGPNVTSNGRGTGPETNYIWSGEPGQLNEWSECTCNNPAGDRRFVIATSDYELAPSTKAKIAFALVTTDTTSMGTGLCPTVNIPGIKTVTDTTWYIYKNPLPPVTGINNLQKSEIALDIYPNPAHDQLYIQRPGNNTANEQVQVYDAIGRNISLPVSYNKDRISIQTGSLPNGMYHILYRNDAVLSSNVFIKE